MGALILLSPAAGPPDQRGGEAALSSRRLAVLGLLALAFLFGGLARLYHIQFAQGDALRLRADANRFVTREVEADRGVVYDAAGRQVVMNKPRFVVKVVTSALPAQPSELNRVLDTLSATLKIPRLPQRSIGVLAPNLENGAPRMGGQERSLRERLPYAGDHLVRTWQPVPIARNVPRDAAFALLEQLWSMPGVLVEESPIREYPEGPALAHVLGFTAGIPPDELADYMARGYAIYDEVGRSGLEATYEDDLRGTKGQKLVEVDAWGRELRQVADPLAPAPGRSLVLTLDVEFQRQVEEILAETLLREGARSGAAVVMDPRNGAIRALVTLPTFDNNIFSAGATIEDFEALVTNPDRPLFNRAVSGQYPPGSGFKLITASAALEEGVANRQTRVVCPGMIVLHSEYYPEITYPFVCWNRGGHGAVNVVDALAQSCDIYFYQVAGGYFESGANQPGLGSQRLGQYARSFGLGASTGIELLGEAAGRVPSAEWFAETQGTVWTTGITYDMGIGQADTLVTPLQMANLTAAVANGGLLYQPHLVEQVVAPDGNTVRQPGHPPRRVPVSSEHLAIVREGMRAVVLSGTARPEWSGLPREVSIGGKTGTAEFCDPVMLGDIPACRKTRLGYLLTHAWFTAFAPYEDPEMVVAVFVDGSGLDRVIEGSQVAAPVAGKIIRAYFNLPEPEPVPPAYVETPDAATGGPDDHPLQTGAEDGPDSETEEPEG